MAKPRELAGSFVPTPESLASSSTSRSRSASRNPDYKDGLRSSSRPGSTSEVHPHHAHHVRYSESTQAGTIMDPERVDHQDFAKKRQSRIKRSGGFLLESAIPGLRRRVSGESKQREQEYEGRAVENGQELSADAEKLKVSKTRKRTVQSSPLSRETMKPEIEDVKRTDHTSFSWQEGLDTKRQSQKTTHVHEDSHTWPSATSSHQNSRRPAPAIDPTQIVNMALNLSESRRRNISVGQVAVGPMANSRRAVSRTPDNSMLLQGSYHSSNTGGSLKQHLQQQRRSSRNISPVTGRSSPRSRHTSTPHSVVSSDPSVTMLENQEVSYRFSDATLARATKARAYLELSIEHRRLLQYLPPLKPDFLAPGNYQVSSSSVPGTTSVELQRSTSNKTAKFPLGRQYNPLQLIRNRKMRARERRPLDTEPEDFEDVLRTRVWVDGVEETSKRRSYRKLDSVNLPTFGHSSDFQRSANNTAMPGQKRPKIEWSFSPGELFADAYWLEQNSNKAAIVNRNGNKIFDSRRPQTAIPPRVSAEISRTMQRTNTSSNESYDGGRSDTYTAEDSDAQSHRGRKRRLLRAEKHGWHGRHRSRSSSGLSSSDDESNRLMSLSHRRTGTIDLNTGPLQSHLNDLIEREKGMISPEVESPDHWGSGHVSLTGEVISPLRKSSVVSDGFEGSGAMKKRPTHLQAKHSVEGPEEAMRNRSSYEDLSSAPNSPGFPRFLPQGRIDSTPPSSRRGSLSKGSTKYKLGTFRSSNPHDGNDSAQDADHTSNSRQTSGDKLSNAPGAKFMPAIGVKHLFSHKRNESRNSIVERIDTHVQDEKRESKETKEPQSAVTRFLKGVKNEGSKVGDFIFRKEAGDDTVSSSDSDLDVSDVGEQYRAEKLKKRPTHVKRSSTSVIETMNSLKPARTRPFKLPIFRSTHVHVDDNDTVSTNEDDIEERKADDRENLLPAMELRTSKTRSENLSTANPISTRPQEPKARPSFTLTRSRSDTRTRLANILEHPGTVGRGGLPVTSLARLSPSPSREPSHSRDRSDQRSNSRHWSISDRKNSQPSTTSTITRADIARTRALLLCTGIKAREITRRAHVVRDEPAPFLRKAIAAASKECGYDTPRVPRMQEHVLAARILSEQLSGRTATLRTETSLFKETHIEPLHKQLLALRALLHDELAPQIKNAGADAETYASRLSRTYPLETKTVVERADILVRARRRKGRWLRRGGWALVEYLLLGAMWWLWLLVTVWRVVRGIVGGTGRAVRWVLWLP
ncbi:hypothetical protein EJ05DRAFT_479380 [Pseudovirgaria hyperparasitica]|uniref:Uncharacterized protein n=1 Tax=Pseudovirgaria hyperparasitica TaxID=470096 RepID=A0A6A6VUM9_9PEZI|nr:uncharacterized protein EJ05DRAFT_479380 [Pseudovirgaria hyperparasitica]KAF2754388.1 hypothetical protein EJ05DRAFT_479380 [Pseudovirgaria hyperparasitica]